MRKILLIGDEIIDEYIFGSCSRISPEAPVPVIEEQRRELRSGGAANVCANLEALGAEVVFFKGNKNPCIKTRVISNNQQIVRIDRDNLEEVSLSPYVEKEVKESDIVMLSDYNKGVVNKKNVERIIELCVKHNRKIAVDPYSNIYSYGRVDFIKPNKKELESVAGIRVSNKKTLVEAGKKYLRLSGALNLIVTLGSYGVALFDYATYKSEPFICSPYRVKEVIDVTGAGDTVFAVLGYIWAYERFSKSTAIKYAVKAASIAISRFGCAVIKGEEVFETDSGFY